MPFTTVSISSCEAKSQKTCLTYLHLPDLHQFFIRQTSAEKVNNVLDLITVLHLINVTYSEQLSSQQIMNSHFITVQ